MANLNLNMEDIDAFLDLDSPYMYGDEYLDTATSSESTSPVMSNYDMSVLPDLQGMYPSSTGSERESTSPQPGSTEDKGSTPAAKPAAKRKRENRYKNAPPSVLSRRRAQNRASQRAYRERKDQRIKDLETLLAESKQKNDSLSQAYTTLHNEYLKLRSTQARNPPTPRHHSINLPFDATNMSVTAGMDLDSMYMFQEMPNYAI